MGIVLAAQAIGGLFQNSELRSACRRRAISSRTADATASLTGRESAGLMSSYSLRGMLLLRDRRTRRAGVEN